MEHSLHTRAPGIVARPFKRSNTLSFIVPIPVFRIVSQIAAVGSFTDWVVSAIQEAADVDPFPSLLSILLFSTVLLSALREPEAPVHPLHGKK